MARKHRGAHERFAVVRRGYDPVEVDAHFIVAESRLEGLTRQLAETESRLAGAEARVAELEYLIDPVPVSRQQAEALVVAAEVEAAEVRSRAQDEAAHMRSRAEREVAELRQQAEEDIAAFRGQAELETAMLLADGRATLAREAKELDTLRMAIVAEAATLAEIEKRLGHRISRAAAAIVEIIDAPGGLGPFTRATASIVEFAKFLQRAAQSGALGEVQIELRDRTVQASIAAPPAPAVPSQAADSGESEPAAAAPAGPDTKRTRRGEPTVAPAGLATGATGGADAVASPPADQLANAANNSSMALS